MIVKDGQSLLEFKKQSPVAEFPDAFSRYVRSFGETYFWKKGKFHVITRAEHAKEILTSGDFSADRGAFFVSRMPNLNLDLIQDFFGVVKKMMVMSDDSEHTERRKFAARGFEDEVISRFSQKLKMTVEQLIHEVKGQREVEFVEAIAKKLPSIVLADLFSIPSEDRASFLKWSNIMTGFFGGASAYQNEDGIEVNHAAKSLKTYFLNLMDQRRISPGEDYVSLTLRGQAHLGLSDDEVVSQLIMMLVAGMATTTDQINNIMFLLAERPSLQNEVRNQLDLVPQMIEECKRFDPAVTFIFRVARKETRIGEQPIAVGDVMFISSHAINRDFPEQEHPDKLNIHRLPRGNFSYGHGAHYCIGAKLARMEMKLLFEKILTELSEFSLNSERESVRDHYSLSFSGFKELHLKFKK